MAEELRTCRRTGCRWPALACMSYRYETREVWLEDLSGEPSPALWDLCPHHADTLTVPRGWDLVDERHDEPAPVEPAGRDLMARADRYAALRLQWPDLVAAMRRDTVDVPGQLAIPVDVEAPEPAGAVVVSIDMAGARRLQTDERVRSQP